jgi:hypothetical protein
VEFTVPYTANSLRASRRRAVRAQRCEDEKKEEEEEEEGVLIVFGHRVTAGYLYSQPLSITPW